jgi:hypothetical protein
MHKVLSTLLFFGFITSPLQAKEYWLPFSVCKAETECKDCVEHIILKISVDAQNKVVTAKGNSTAGAPIREALKNCEVHSVDKWGCKDYQSEFSALDGKISYRRNPSRFIVDGTSFEICSK